MREIDSNTLFEQIQCLIKEFEDNLKKPAIDKLTITHDTVTLNAFNNTIEHLRKNNYTVRIQTEDKEIRKNLHNVIIPNKFGVFAGYHGNLLSGLRNDDGSVSPFHVEEIREDPNFIYSVVSASLRETNRRTCTK